MSKSAQHYVVGVLLLAVAMLAWVSEERVLGDEGFSFPPGLVPLVCVISASISFARARRARPGK